MRFFLKFILATAFLGLVFLAFNPSFVVDIQNEIQEASEIAELEKPSLEPPVSPPSKPPILPVTLSPDIENLPRLKDYSKIAKNDPWIGEAPCSADIFEAPLTLPGLGERRKGPRLTTPLNTYDNYQIQDQPTFIFKSKKGVRLKLVQPVIEYYDVRGQRFLDVQNDIFDRKPLEKIRGTNIEDEEVRSSNSRGDKTLRVTRAADIYSPTSLSYTLTGSRNRYRLAVRKTMMTTGYLVTLPRWTGYAAASLGEQRKWDDFFCNVAHHELGHLRIRLDILAETLDGYAALPPAQSFDEMEALAIAYRKKINRRIQARQDAYHIYNDGGMRRGMIERPYTELPFPWLETEQAELKTAEQSPE